MKDIESPTLKIYKITPAVDIGSQGVFEHAIVCADSALDAARIHPSGKISRIGNMTKGFDLMNGEADWVQYSSQVKVEPIGRAFQTLSRGVLSASFVPENPAWED